MLAIAEGDDVVVPPTLQALLAARLDRLDDAARAVLECAAVEGEIFHRGAVQALVPDEPKVTPQLAALVRRQLIAPDRAQVRGDDGFRFRHLLIRDAAYDALPKARRADLHEGLAGWLEEHAPRVEHDELLGYHLEQAVRYRMELGRPPDGELATAARERLTAAGRRALRRLDFGTAAGFLERAGDLVPPGAPDLALELDLIDALTGDRKGEEALSRTRSIVSRAAAADDSIGELCGRILDGIQRIHLAPTDATVELEALVAEALPVFEAAGNQLALRIAYRALGEAANMRAQMDQVAAAYEQAASYDSPAGLTGLVGYQSHARFFGSTPLTELLAWQEKQDAHDQRGYFLGAHRCLALAMLGRRDEARALLAELRAELAERGGAQAMVAGIEGYAMVVEFLAGDLEAAVTAGEDSCRLSGELGRWSELSTTAGGLAGVYYELGRLDEAERWAARAAELGAEEDAITQMLWRQARARVLAGRGEYDEAERLAREAVGVGETTEDLNSKAETWADLGEVLTLAGRPREAAEALEQAMRASRPRRTSSWPAGCVSAWPRFEPRSAECGSCSGSHSQPQRSASAPAAQAPRSRSSRRPRR
jgi:tetratricopeptide (TPR) repeat protein